MLIVSGTWYSIITIFIAEVSIVLFKSRSKSLLEHDLSIISVMKCNSFVHQIIVRNWITYFSQILSVHYSIVVDVAVLLLALLRAGLWAWLTAVVQAGHTVWPVNRQARLQARYKPSRYGINLFHHHTLGFYFLPYFVLDVMEIYKHWNSKIVIMPILSSFSSIGGCRRYVLVIHWAPLFCIWSERKLQTLDSKKLSWCQLCHLWQHLMLPVMTKLAS